MLRQTLARSAWRSARRPAANATRAFSATAQRPAEVELTIGMCLASLAHSRDSEYFANLLKDGKKVSIEGSVIIRSQLVDPFLTSSQPARL